jgi:pimeloyl-ACP methyl ester carboxylesterase
MVDEFALISMAKATAPSCSRMAADSTKRAGGIRPALVSAGFRVLAIDFRGFGCSSGPGQADLDNAPFENDVLAAVRYLKTHGVKTVSVVGGSFGGGAAGDASIKSVPGEIDRIVFLGVAPNLSAEQLKSRALFIVARDDGNDDGPRLPGIRPGSGASEGRDERFLSVHVRLRRRQPCTAQAAGMVLRRIRTSDPFRTRQLAKRIHPEGRSQRELCGCCIMHT